jgi:hypothetical protein
MKKFVLDYSKWRSGGDSETKVGDGKTCLLNKDGYMCCLGQWALQEGAPTTILLGAGEPNDLKVDDDEFGDENGKRLFFDDPQITPLASSQFCNKAIDINDDTDTPPMWKVDSLKKLCSEYGVELEVINIPDH